MFLILRINKDYNLSFEDLNKGKFGWHPEPHFSLENEIHTWHTICSIEQAINYNHFNIVDAFLLEVDGDKLINIEKVELKDLQKYLLLI